MAIIKKKKLKEMRKEELLEKLKELKIMQEENMICQDVLMNIFNYIKD